MVDKSSKYELGYGKPPKSSQFQPGKSGNPGGRPKGSKNRLMTRDVQSRVMDIIIEQAEASITVNEAGRRFKISALEGVVKSIIMSAIKGKPGAQRLAMDMAVKAALTKQQQHNDKLQAVSDFKHYMTPVYEEREKFEALGDDVGPAPSRLHPKDILIDDETGEVTILHPKSREWMEQDKEFTAARDAHLADIKYLQELLDTEVNQKYRASTLEDIERAKDFIALYEQIIPKSLQ